MNTITVNGTTFTGEMILNAVARTMVFDYHMNLIKEEEIPAGPYYGIMEKNLGGWRFLRYSDGRGNWYTEHFSF